MNVTVKDVTDAVYDRYGGVAPTIKGGVNLGAIVLMVIDVLSEMGFGIEAEREASDA